MLREEVLEASWRAGRELSEPRLDTAVDVNRAIARYLELLKLAALAQRPGEEATGEAIEAVNGLLRQVATPEQQAELDASALDAYLLDTEREGEARRRLIAARREPSLEAFLPRRGDGALSLSASDLDLYLTCPLKYKFGRVFGIPQEPTINQRFGILVHSVLERFHKEAGAGEEDSVERLMELFEAGWRRAGFGASDDELQFRDRARAAMRLYWEREREGEGEPAWLERKFDMRIGAHHVRGRVDRVDRLPGGGYELIDYKTGERKSEADLRATCSSRSTGSPPARPGASRPRPAATTTCSTPTRSPRRSGPTTPSGSSARCCRSARASSARTSSRAPRRSSAAGATTGSICPAARG
jgi:DNA helicase-2/ATP-dependent DNA helicase PcrA